MTYRYCDNKECDMPLPKPTPREDLLEGGSICPHCETIQDPVLTLAEWFVELYEEFHEP